MVIYPDELNPSMFLRNPRSSPAIGMCCSYWADVPMANALLGDPETEKFLQHPKTQTCFNGTMRGPQDS